MMRIQTYKVYKLEITDLVYQDENKKFHIVDLNLTEDEAINQGKLIRIQENQLIYTIRNLKCVGNDIGIFDYIVNIHVDTELRTKGEKMYKKLAQDGFTLNGKDYVRFASGSGQIRRNTICFIQADLDTQVFNKLLCGLDINDFDSFVSSKFNAYHGLSLSGCHLLPQEYSPNVCVVDDMESLRPHDTVNYVTEEDVRYIALPDGDYVLSDNDKDYDIQGSIAIRKSDNLEFPIERGTKKYVNAMPYDEIETSPYLNSFDGQGLMCPAWAQEVAEYLDYGYLPSAMIIRAPWCKGLLATVDFHSWFHELGITEITDSFGKIRQIEDVDVLLSKSQFKTWKVYAKKFEGTSINPWDYFVENMKANNLRWGICKPDKPTEDEKTMNYQYLEALDIDNEDIESLCQKTKDFFFKLNSGDIKEVYENLIGKSLVFVDDAEEEEETDSKDDSRPRYQKALEANPCLVNDKYIRSLILQECESKLNAAKLGKIIVRGNYQFCISDPIAQMQWISVNHCGRKFKVKGVVPSGCIYSNYWMNSEDNNGVVTLLRSPLIDRNEIAKRKLVKKTQEYFKYLRSGIIYSIHDLTALQQGGANL